MQWDIGGAYEFEFGTSEISHKHSIVLHYTTEDGEIIYAGMPGRNSFHSRRKNYLSCRGYGIIWGYETNWRTKCILMLHFLPIGDNFTMGPEDAAYATELLKPKVVVPIHYNTFPWN